MDNLTYSVNIDVTSNALAYNVYIASKGDMNIRFLNVALYGGGNRITFNEGATATAAFVTDGVLIDDSVECDIVDSNVIVVPLMDFKKFGKLDVQITIVDGEQTLSIPFPIQIKVTPNIAEEAQVTGKSMGSYAEVVQEIAEARRGYDSLDERLANTSHGFITPGDFGAVGDGVNDDTDALQNAIKHSLDDNVPFKGEPGKVYLISKPIEIIRNEKEMFSCGFDFCGATIKARNTDDGGVIPQFYLLTSKYAPPGWNKFWDKNWNNYYKKEISYVPLSESVAYEQKIYYRKAQCALYVNFIGEGAWQKHAKITIENLVIDGNDESVHTGIFVERAEGMVFQNINIYNTRRGVLLHNGIETMFRKCTVRRSVELDLVKQLEKNETGYPKLEGVFPEGSADSDRVEKITDGTIDLLATQCVGFEFSTTDAFLTDCVAIDYVIGVKLIGSDHKVQGCHIWNTALKQLRSSCCFLTSGGNYFTDCTCDRFHIGFYLLYNQANYLVNTLFTNQSLGETTQVDPKKDDFANDKNYCFFFNEKYNAYSRGKNLFVKNTRLNGNKHNEMISVKDEGEAEAHTEISNFRRTLYWNNLDVSVMDDGTNGNCIFGYYPRSREGVSYGKIESVPGTVEVTDYCKDENLIDGTYNEYSYNGILRTAGGKFTTATINGVKVHTISQKTSESSRPRFLIGRGLEDGHIYLIRYKYKYGQIESYDPETQEPLTWDDGCKARVFKVVDNAPAYYKDTVIGSLDLKGDGEEHDYFNIFKFKQDVRIDVGYENSEKYKENNPLVIKNVCVFDITNIPRYFFESRCEYFQRLKNLFGADSTATSIDVAANNDVSFVSLAAPLDFDYTNKTPKNSIDYETRYNAFGRPVLKAKEDGIQTYAEVPCAGESVSFDLIINKSKTKYAEAENTSENVADKKKLTYQNYSTPQSNIFTVSKLNAPMKVTLFNDITELDRTVISLKVGKELDCDSPVVDSGGIIPCYENGKIYVVKKNSENDAELPTVLVNFTDENAKGLTAQEKSDIANIVLQLLPTTQEVLYGNASD